MRELKALVISLLLTGCTSTAPLFSIHSPPPVQAQRVEQAEVDLLSRMLRNLYKENLADDVDNGRPLEHIPLPRGGLIFEGMNRAWILRAMLYPLSDKIIKKEFNKPSQPDQTPRIDQAGVQALMRHLQPGDIVLCGNNDAFVHALIYLGQDEIIHALAQLTPQGDFLGVVRESLTGYIQRVPRDKFLVLRKPGTTAEDVQKMRAYLNAQVGKSYDSLFLYKNDDRFYCTELTWKALQQMAHPPRIYPHRAKYGWELLTNEDFMDSPDLQTVWSYHYTRPPVGQRHPYRSP